MATFQIIVTNVGRAALVNAQANGVSGVTITACGISNQALTPDPTLTALPNELKRLSGTDVSGTPAAPAVLHLVVRDESADAYSMKSFGLYLNDGTLFAVYGQNSNIFSKVASSLMLLAVDIDFADITATNITFGDTNFLNPPATTTTQGVVELADDGEAQAMVDAIKGLTPRGLGLVFTAAKILAQLLKVDGAGSGLDADLLDGRDGSYYTAIAARLGFTPVQQGSGVGQQPNLVKIGWTSANRLGVTVDATDLGYLVSDQVLGGGGLNINGKTVGRGGISLWGPDNDGSGSGLDADLLDGRDSTWFSDIVARLGFRPVQQGGGVGQQTNSVAIGWTTANRLAVTVDSTDLGYVVTDQVLSGGGLHVTGSTMARGGSSLWGPDNDGSGSGLDADLLDGYDSSFYFDVAGIKAMQGNISFDNQPGRTVSWFNPGVFFYGYPNRFGLYDAANNRTVWEYNQSSIQLTAYTNLDVTGYLHRGGYQVWDSGNDGAGSGLDADLLDGHQASDFAQINMRVSFQDVIAARDANTGALFLGANLAHFLYFDGVNYQMPGGNLLVNSGTVWHSGNDGAGSGLDADMLDGYDSSFFTAITDRLGFTPVQQGTGAGQQSNVVKLGWGGNNRLRLTVDSTDLGNIVTDDNLNSGGLNMAGQSMRRGGNDLWGPDNDGAGSGLDADLLDGHEASDFAQLGGAGFNGTVSAPHLQAGSGGLGVNGNADIDGYLHRAGNNVWDVGNDGSGSGLDADLLDGRQGSEFALLSGFGSNLNGSGFQALPNGMFLQWGEAAHTDNSGAQQVNFPTAFPNNCFQIVVTNEAQGIPVAFHGAGNLSRGGCTVYSASTSGGPGLKGTAFRYIAIGN